MKHSETFRKNPPVIDLRKDPSEFLRQLSLNGTQLRKFLKRVYENILSLHEYTVNKDPAEDINDYVMLRY